MMRSLLGDLRYASRLLWNTPGVTAIAVMTLGIGIGANTAIFSYVDATWLRPLPVRDPDRMVRIFASEHDATGYHPRGSSSYVDSVDMREQATAFTDLLSYEHRGGMLYGTGEVTRLAVDVVSANYFAALGISPMLGQVFTESETPGEAPGVVISYDLWRERFGSDPAVPGKHARLTLADVTILGVMPRWFRGLDLGGPPAVWVPPSAWQQMTGPSAEFARRGNRRREILARLQPGVSIAQAQAQLDTIGDRLARVYPDTNKDTRFTVVPEMETRGDDVRRQGTILLAIALAVALIASANLANLQLARAETRRRDTATRLALGGGRSRLVRQWMAEGGLLATAGCGLALLLGGWTIRVLPALFETTLIGGQYDFRLDRRALLVTMLVAVGATVISGLAPALQAVRIDVATALRESRTGSSGRHAVRDLLVVAQVAASVVLLIAAGLLVRTYENLHNANYGFNPRQNVLLLYVVPELANPEEARVRSYYDRVQERLGALPGVEQVSLAQRVPFSPFLGGAQKEIVVPGLAPPEGRKGFSVNFDVVGPGYFSLMGTRLLRGREFAPQDGRDMEKVVIVNDTMAQRFWPGRIAVGEHFRIGNDAYGIVGVVEDAKWEAPAEMPRSLLYLPISQHLSDGLMILLRTGTDPGSLVTAARSELQRIDSTVPLLSAVTLAQHVKGALNDERSRSQLVSAFAGLGLLLAATGLYGVLAYVVTRRTREIGIRMAVGATRSDVLRLVLGHALRRVFVGLGAGLVLALALPRVISGLLFGVTPGDPLTLAAVAVLLVIVGVLAALVPARRATRVDPIVALRFD